MTLITGLRRHLGDEDASSFQLMGEDAVLLTGEDLREAGRAYEEALVHRVPANLHARFREEQRGIQRRAHRWLQRYNRNLYTRIDGYVALGRLCRFEYPWPTVAVLGLTTVLDGMGRMRAFGLVGRAAARVGLPLVEQVSERIDDLLRRTNRGIFADSIPATLYALRCHELRRAGEASLARALLEGPLPPLMDEEVRELTRGLAEGFSLEDGEARFRRLSQLTLERFEREQAVFTHHLGERRRVLPRPFASLAESWISNPRSVSAPRIKRGLLGRRVCFEARRMPSGFDIRAHGTRVSEFGRLFVSSITNTQEDYQTAVDYVIHRFGAGGERLFVSYPPGGTPAAAAYLWEPERSGA